MGVLWKMKAMLKIELERAFKGYGFAMAMIIGALLAVEHYIRFVLPITDFMLFGFHPDAGSSFIHSVCTSWMGVTFEMEMNIYIYIVVILIMIPHAASYYQDKKSGLLKNFYTRQNKVSYLFSKSIATFLSAGTVAVSPLILSLILTSATLPSLQPHAGVIGPVTGAFFVSVYYENVTLYYILYILVIFVYAGLAAGIALTVSLFANNIFVVLTFPFLLWQTFTMFVPYMGSEVLKGMTITQVFHIGQLGPKNELGMLLLFIILLLCGYITFIVRGNKNETY